MIDYVLPYCDSDTFKHTQWRKEKFWNELCDRVFKFNMSLIQKLYERYSAESRLKPGSKKYVSLDEFVKMCTDSGLIERYINERDPSAVYNISMMTVVNELESERGSQMSFPEFVEALARVSDKIDDKEVTNHEGLHSKILFLLQQLADGLYNGTVEVVKPPPIVEQWEE